jgi:antitoxin (DNA-binding transcriptional repressor) of toxin-antitoxin stability system
MDFALKTISSAVANRHFSTLLRDVSTGEVFTALSRGRPVATIGPAHASAGAREAARLSLVERLHSQSPAGSGDWTRDELYDH